MNEETAPTIESLLAPLGSNMLRRNSLLLGWPPDVYGLAAMLLKHTGSYWHVIQDWPPKSHKPDWEKHVKTVGWQWVQCAGALKSTQAIPSPVKTAWNRLVNSRATRIDKIHLDRRLCCALLSLVAYADSASAGAGLEIASSESAAQDFFWFYCQILLSEGTLCSFTPTGFYRVLPKQHAPRSGLSIHSLTHNLAFFRGTEVVPKWYTTPMPLPDGALNVVLAPWPHKVARNAFRPTDGDLVEMPNRFGFFELSDVGDQNEPVTDWLKKVLSHARDLCGRVDAVIFPECSLSETEYQAVQRMVLAEGAFLVAGIRGASNNKQLIRKGRAKTRPPKRNLLKIAVGTTVPSKPMVIEQDKHHRWRLDRSQLDTYKLGGQLTPSKEWWEYCEVGPRQIAFTSLKPNLLLCGLICEDLARQDPVAELVRSVGPNLVVALLMDGPQLQSRWPARYATVLAEDPGSSVLTLTSAGMMRLSTPPAGFDGKLSKSIGLWKDSSTPKALELELEHDKGALLLNLFLENAEEWTADGRSDQRVSFHPRLSAVHQLNP